MGKTKLKQNIRWISVVSCLLMLVILSVACIRLNKENRFSIGGCSFYIIASGSMSPEYPKNSLVVIKDEPFELLSEGDVIAFESDALGKKYAFHRIIRHSENGFYTKGDNSSHEDNQLITKQNYRGKCIYKFYLLGLYLSSIREPIGFVLFLALPLLALMQITSSIKKLIAQKRLL